MENVRKPFQGVLNIIKFNWHFYAIAFSCILILIIFSFNTSGLLCNFLLLTSLAIMFSLLLSLVVSFFVYDYSNLYILNWLPNIKFLEKEKIVNINAGFDETSELLERKFPQSEIIALDFYDAQKHTEVSIKRARKAYPLYKNTITISTDKLSFQNDSIDKIFLILSAHEIRNNTERAIFFTEIKRVLKNEGKVIVTEHLRNLPNFLAYNIGFFHFHSKATWFNTFNTAELIIQQEISITPFIKTFILCKNGVTH